MNIIQRKYEPETDFTRIRDFLVETFSLTAQPINWKLERWNYARHFITPMLVTEGIGDPDREAIKKAELLWNNVTGIWENDTGQIVGVVNIEHAHQQHTGWGEAFLQHHPDYDAVLPEMLVYAEEHLRNRDKNLIFTPIYDYDDALIAAVQERGFLRNEKYTLWDSVYTLDSNSPRPALPGGYRLGCMADRNSDIEFRRKAFGLAFNHPNPKDWPSQISYQGLQQAPDYRPDLDFYVVAPDGEYAAFCIAWWDEFNQIASLEPIGTVPEHRRKGLARAVVFEAIQRVSALGASRVFVGSDQEFYLSLGFELSFPARHWKKQF
jgi:predicted N-acetyltransferase YhbS